MGEYLDFATRDNVEKAKSGAEFHRRLAEGVLDHFVRQGIIDTYMEEPSYGNGCFNPNFEIWKGNIAIVVDTTTTARSDRLKGKQWDAFHAKRILESRTTKAGKTEKVLAFVVVKNVQGREEANFKRAKEWVRRCYYESIDDVLSVEEFAEMLLKL